MSRNVLLINLVLLFVIGVTYILYTPPTQVMHLRGKVESAQIVRISATASPITINTCNSLVVLINKTYGMGEDYIPPDLVSFASQEIPAMSTSLQGRALEMPDLKDMITAAQTQQLSLIVLSPYRSYQTQATLYTGYVQADGKASADAASAIAGHSQHQLGTAIDFTSNEINNALDVTFGDTKAGQWMMDHAYLYGFVMSYPKGYEAITGYEYEPWHYRYVGVETALYIHKSGLILEQYLQKYGVHPSC